ncbi:MAG: cytochrome c [Bacteriovoracaceae bacterium]|nr:cytochrome c [Bacteriovoracaceae bacterium]
MISVSYKFIILAIISINSVYSTTPDWGKDSQLPGQEKCFWKKDHEVCLKDGNRANIYNESQLQYDQETTEGAKHALYYPVTVTNLVIPNESVEKFFNEQAHSPLRKFIFKIAKKISQFESMEQIFDWLGLHKYPERKKDYGPNKIPFMGSKIQSQQMGVTNRRLHGADVTTFSCAACHSSDLFGVKVLGMTNRFPKANEFFHLGQSMISKVPTKAFELLFNPSDEDLFIFRNAKKALKHVEVVKPLALGLDTSLAQVGLSLSKRSEDEYASFSPWRARFPRSNPLREVPADSKPAVWWNLKYKTRWLSDGSIVSGNPIHTNFLWNEIGRGVDLHELELWLDKNTQTIKELTSFVFSTKAPAYNDFFPNEINIAKAQRGEKLFLKNCAGCHGQYDKGWSENSVTSYKHQIKTTKVWYHKRTPVIDVGTDPYRREGMRYFYKDLNRLKISESIGTVVKPQDGYVPPPLVGIWARWPYFHNNSVPTLFDVLTPDYKRPKSYVSVPAQDKKLDFDKIKNGYPAPDKIRAIYRNDKEFHFNANRAGTSNKGHTSMLVDEDGVEKFTKTQKLEIIEFLKTL